MSTCGYPGCQQDTSHRPYARKRDAPSASAIAEMLDDGKARSFAWAASLIAATEAVHHPDNWHGLINIPSDRAATNGIEQCDHTKNGLCKACTYLRTAFDREWSAKANLGTHVHHLAVSWAEGQPVQTDPTTDPYIDALEEFYKLRDPEWLTLEATVQGVRGGKVDYRGQFDWIARINCPVCQPVDSKPGRCTWLGDWKSGGFYPTSQTLQLALYRYAKNLTDWSTGKETVTRPMPPVAHAGVCLLGPDGHARLVELPVDAEAYNTALRLLDIRRWQQQMKRWAKDNPLPDIETETEGDIE